MFPPSQRMISACSCLAQNQLIVNSCIDHLIPLSIWGSNSSRSFDGAVVPVCVLISGKPHGYLLFQIAIGHRVPDDSHFFSRFGENTGNIPGGLAFAAPGSYCCYSHHFALGFEHSCFWPHQPEIGTTGQSQRSLMHHIFMGYIAVGKNHLIHIMFFDQFRQLFFCMDGDPFRIKLPCQAGRYSRPSISGI